MVYVGNKMFLELFKLLKISNDNLGFNYQIYIDKRTTKISFITFDSQTTLGKGRCNGTRFWILQKKKKNH